MINELLAARSGYFYKIQGPIPKKAITGLFRSLRAGKASASQNHFYCVRESVGAALWSAISFMYDRIPAFLDQSTRMRERVGGFLLLVEYGDHLCLFKSQLDLPLRFVSKHLERINPEKIDAGLTSEQSIFERVRLRHMTISKLALRGKTLEADDLENSVGPGSSSRFAAVGYDVRKGDEHFSTTPTTGRIAQRSGREGHRALIEYACEVIDRMAAPATAPAAFLHAFARSLDLTSTTARPTSLAIDVAFLRSAVFDDRTMRLVCEVNGIWQGIPHATVEDLMSELDGTFIVDGSDKVMNLRRSSDCKRVGSISINKSRIALRSLDLPSASRIGVERSDTAAGQDPERVPLREFLDQTDAFIVLFSTQELAYIGGTLYRDDAMTNGGETFLRYFFPEPELAAVTDEKGFFTTAQTEFDRNSTFGVVIRVVSARDDILVCDDLGDEWADFIGLCTDSISPRITFYHAKHGDLSLGASPFHISVSQAIKNLGRLALHAESIPSKIRCWRATYNNDGVETAIPRVSRGNPSSLESAFKACREAPQTTRRVAIVTSSLSKAAITTVFNDIRAGQRADPHFIQLYWLLASFFSACAEVNAFGYVVCQP